MAYRQLKPDIRRYQTCALIQFGYLLRVLQHLATGKPDKVSGLCAKAIRKLQAKHFDTHLHAQSFYYMQLAAQIQLGQYDAGLQSLDQLLGCVQAGDFNWFKFRELGLMLMLHTARYEEAVFLFNETVSNPCSEALSESNMLYWEMCCNYLMLLHRAGTVETEPQRGRLPVNDEPWQNRIEPEENMAPYTALLILDWLRLFQEQRHAELRRLSINLNRHAIRYQKLGVQTRSYCFLKFLCLLSSTDFTGEAMDTLAISAMEQLGKVPVQIAQQTLEIELIPYDALWRLIRKMPEQKDRKSAPSGVTHSAGSGSCGA